MTVMTALMSAALIHAIAPPPEEPAATIPAPGGQLLASQIAEVPPHRDTVIARIPEGAVRAMLSEEARLRLVRNRYPGSRFPLRHGGTVEIVHEAQDASAGDARCVASRTLIPAGTYLSERHVEAASCRHARSDGWLGYDAAARAFVARRPIPPGTYLGRMAAIAAPATSAGESLVYRTSEGPVTVEREVIALQAGREGRRVFVRTEDGRVLAAPLSAEETE